MVQPASPTSNQVSNGELSPSQSSNLLPLILPVVVATTGQETLRTSTNLSLCKFTKLGEVLLSVPLCAALSVSPVVYPARRYACEPSHNAPTTGVVSTSLVA